MLALSAGRCALVPLVAALCFAPAAACAAPQVATAPALKPGEARIVVDGHPATARASSTLPSKDGRYSVANLFDGRLDTAWVEGADSMGVGEWLEIEFDEPVELDGFLLAPGYGKSEKTFLENVAPFWVEVLGDGQRLSMNAFRYPMSSGCIGHGTPTAWGPRAVVFQRVAKVKRLRLTILEATWGFQMRYRDLAISEWRPIIRDRPAQPPPGWGPIVAFTVDLLRGLRRDVIEKRFLSATVGVEDVFKDAAHLDSLFSEQLKVSLMTTGAAPGQDPLLNFQALARKMLNGTTTLVSTETGHALVGERLFHIGDDDESLAFNFALFVEPSSNGSFVITSMRVMAESMKCNDAMLPDLSGLR
jgi:hypothetical protein